MSDDLFSKFGVPAPVAFTYKAKVYVAEAQNEVRLFLANHLQKVGFEDIRTCREGVQALRDLKSQPADILMIDDALPGVSGLDMLKELKEDPACARGAFILLSKARSKAELMLAVENGIDDLLIRPFAAGDLLPKVRAAYANFNNPKNPERLYEFAKVQIRAGQMDKAQQIYEALAASASNAARPLVGLARIAFKKGDQKTALTHLAEAIKRNANFVHAYVLRGEIYAGMNDIANAQKDMLFAVELSPLNVARYYSCSELFLKHDQLDPCIKVLGTAMQHGLQDPFISEQLGMCHFKKKEFSQAAEFLKEAVKLDPSNTKYLNSLAICYRDGKDYDSAVSTYNAILKKEPTNHAVLFNKALVYIHKGDKPEARRLLERVLKLDASFTKAQEKLNELGSE